MVKRVLYNDTETLMVRLQSHLLGSYVTDDLHTARISNDERVLYNDTETLMVRLLSHLLGSYVTHVLHTARISNDDRVLYNDTEALIVRLLSHLLGSYVTHVLTITTMRAPLKTSNKKFRSYNTKAGSQSSYF